MIKYPKARKGDWKQKNPTIDRLEVQYNHEK
jgi:hypothetical protein